MLAVALILIATLAQPAAEPRPSGHDPEPVVVEGRVELTPAEADAAAHERAAAEARWALERRAEALRAHRSPVWLPAPIGERCVADWLRQLDLSRTYEVLAVERARHEHGGYQSYSTRLRVRPDDAAIGRAIRSLERRIDLGSRRFAWLLGGTAGLWALLGFAYGWLDRLTRGYMPWRLRLVCVGMAVAAPGIALLFV